MVIRINLQRHLWKQIPNLNQTNNTSWLIIGDFNDLSSSKEKLSANQEISTDMSNLICLSIKMNLQTWLFSLPYTKYNRRDKTKYVSERLDRALAIA